MQVAIVGLGLMGGSLGAALREHAVAQVIGFDVSPSEAAIALERGCVDAVAATLDEACAAADLIVVATPVSAIAATVEQALNAAPSATITDIGSTKGHVVAAVNISAVALLTNDTELNGPLKAEVFAVAQPAVPVTVLPGLGHIALTLDAAAMPAVVATLNRLQLQGRTP